MCAARARTWRPWSPHGSGLGYLPWLISGLIPERDGMPLLYQQQPKEVTITWRFSIITTTTTNPMLIIIIIIIVSKIPFLLHIHKKDLFLLPTPTEVAFNTTNAPKFYSSGIHLSPVILAFWGLLCVVSYWTPDLSTPNFTKSSRF